MSNPFPIASSGRAYPFSGLTLVLCVFGIVGLYGGCRNQSGSAAEITQAAQASPSPGDVPDVLATIDDQKITMEDIRARAGGDLDGLEINYQLARHKLIETTLDQILQERVLLAEAQKQGKSVEDLVVAEAGATLEPTDVEVSTWFAENEARLGGRSLDELRSQIVDYLRNQHRAEAGERLQQRLNRERKVEVLLRPYRVPLNNTGAPTLGRADAPVTLTIFSDFQCPYCGQFFPVLKQLERSFGDTLQVIYRQFPLPNLHPNAQKAAEASLCANEQGKFWEMHDLMFQEQDRLSVKELKEKAGRLGMDQGKFDACLDNGRYVEQIQEDQKEGNRVGVNGTPAVFINGVPLPGGAVSLDVASKAIRKAVEQAEH